MNSLLATRLNILYAKERKEKPEDPDKFKKFLEVILICDKPTYEITNETEIVRKRGTEQLRFIVSEKNLDTLIEQLKAYRDAKYEDLEA